MQLVTNAVRSDTDVGMSRRLQFQFLQKVYSNVGLSLGWALCRALEFYYCTLGFVYRCSVIIKHLRNYIYSVCNGLFNNCVLPNLLQKFEQNQKWVYCIYSTYILKKKSHIQYSQISSTAFSFDDIAQCGGKFMCANDISFSQNHTFTVLGYVCPISEEKGPWVITWSFSTFNIA